MLCALRLEYQINKYSILSAQSIVCALYKNSPLLVLLLYFTNTTLKLGFVQMTFVEKLPNIYI